MHVISFRSRFRSWVPYSLSYHNLSSAWKIPIDFCGCYTELVALSSWLLGGRRGAVDTISILSVLSLGSLLIKRDGRSE